MEVVFKGYYLNDGMLQKLNKAHENSNLAKIKHSNESHDDNDISVTMEIPEPPNTTLQSRVRVALQ